MLLFLAKVFEEKQHADAFLEGKLFARRLRYFKELEDAAGRGDNDEGVTLLASDNAILTLRSVNQESGEVESITVPSKDLTGPLEIRPEWIDYVHVYCMYAGHSGDFEVLSEDNAEALTRQLEIPSQYQEMGKHAVIVTGVGEFLARVRNATEREGYNLGRGLVNYYDYASGTPHQDLGLGAIFAKQSKFAWQREYRFAFDTGELGSDPITLEIGAIDDLAFYVPTSEINSMISVQLPESKP